MNYRIIERGLGLVVLGDFHPEHLNVDAMIENDIIIAEESGRSRQQVCNNNTSEFNIVNLRVSCDRYRLQMATVDIVMKERLCELCAEILRWQNTANLQGIGVNPHLKVSFNSEEEHSEFVNRLMPPSATWGQFYEGATTSSFQIRKQHVEGTSEYESLIVQIVAVNNGLPIYNVDMNIHHQEITMGRVLDVCSSASAVCDERIISFESFLNEL